MVLLLEAEAAGAEVVMRAVETSDAGLAPAAWEGSADVGLALLPATLLARVLMVAESK